MNTPVQSFCANCVEERPLERVRVSALKREVMLCNTCGEHLTKRGVLPAVIGRKLGQAKPRCPTLDDYDNKRLKW